LAYQAAALQPVARRSRRLVECAWLCSNAPGMRCGGLQAPFRRTMLHSPRSSPICSSMNSGADFKCAVCRRAGVAGRRRKWQPRLHHRRAGVPNPSRLTRSASSRRVRAFTSTRTCPFTGMRPHGGSTARSDARGGGGSAGIRRYRARRGTRVHGVLRKPRAVVPGSSCLSEHHRTQRTDRRRAEPTEQCHGPAS